MVKTNLKTILEKTGRTLYVDDTVLKIAPGKIRMANGVLLRSTAGLAGAACTWTAMATAGLTAGGLRASARVLRSLKLRTL